MSPNGAEESLETDEGFSGPANVGFITPLPFHEAVKSREIFERALYGWFDAIHVIFSSIKKCFFIQNEHF